MTAADDTLQLAVRAEHAAIYAYGVLGAHLPLAQQSVAAEAERAHRTRRDAAAAVLTARSVEPAVAAPSYAVPTLVNAAAARTFAAGVEERCGAAWRAAVAQLTGAERRLAAEALADCAVRAARWRLAANPAHPPTVAFPGEVR